MREKICGKFKETLNARISTYLIPIVASVVLVIVLCVLVLCLSDKWESCIPSKMVPDYKESDGMVSFFWNDFNFYGIVATVLALFSLWYTFLAYRSQSLTESNTRNVPIEDQVNMFKGFARHEYRNLVVVMATAVKFFSKENQSNGHRIAYPSENHLLKLQAGPEDFVLNIDSKIAARVSEMRILQRNFNIDVEVACKHLQRATINSDVLYRDYDNLIFRPFYMLRKTCEIEAKMMLPQVKNKSQKEKGDEYIKELAYRSIDMMVIEHLLRLPYFLKEFLYELHCCMNSANVKEQTKYFQYLELFANDKDVFLECDKFATLQRSFRFLFRINRKEDGGYKPLLHTCNFDHYMPKYFAFFPIDEILHILPELERINPKNFDWLKLYKVTLHAIRGKEEIDFQSFFPLMLKMDILVELPKIGMVNYE